jgi:putative transposase
MPAKNSVKQFIEDGYYHLYNRGVDKRIIFIDEQDYAVFLGYLKEYLAPPPNAGSDPHSLSLEIDLLAFCLMPNHYHLLVKQKSKNGITKLIRAICTNYVMYFNKKYQRVGTLFQGKYKAVLVDTDEYLLHLSRYIHLNPYPGSDPKKYKYSSYNYYLKLKTATWLKPQEILSFFESKDKIDIAKYTTYENFIDDYKIEAKNALGNLTLEELGSDPI